MPHLQDSVLLSISPEAAAPTSKDMGTDCLVLKPAGLPDGTSQGSWAVCSGRGRRQQTELLSAVRRGAVAAVREEGRTSTAALGRSSVGFLDPKVQFEAKLAANLRPEETAFRT